MAADPHESQSNYTLIDHLSELRDRIVRSVWAVVVCAVAAWFFKEPIFQLLTDPIAPQLQQGSLVFTNVVDPFMINLKISIVTGITFATPIWLYQAWMFIAPGLYANEKKYTVGFITAGTLLFVIGVVFAYLLVLPAGLKFLLEMAPNPENSPVRAMIDITKYLSFLTTTALVFGLAFEMPLAITMLGVIGIIDQRFLREKRRFAILGMAILAAIVTPPDALSMLLLLLPLMVLYEISILVVGLLGSKPASGN
ncbi:MAG: twin-arginine translocase subunit TatC [Bdellovibrionaceae bacterium]|nr:twin-arginine translocase subunit TatC [Pseudobdellovibrionaceae bacterium]